MRKAIAVGLVVMLLTTGCGGPRLVTVTGSRGRLEEVAREIAGKNATVTLVDGSELSGRVTSLAADSTTVILNAPVARDTTLATACVGRIAVGKRLRGALLGGLKGFLIGTAVGLLLVSGGDDDDDEPIFEFAEAVMGVVFVGGAGCASGALIGAFSGSRDVYDLAVPGTCRE